MNDTGSMYRIESASRAFRLELSSKRAFSLENLFHVSFITPVEAHPDGRERLILWPGRMENCAENASLCSS